MWNTPNDAPDSAIDELWELELNNPDPIEILPAAAPLPDWCYEDGPKHDAGASDIRSGGQLTRAASSSAMPNGAPASLDRDTLLEDACRAYGRAAVAVATR